MSQFRSDTRLLCISSYYFENFIGKSVNWMSSHKISRTVTKSRFKFAFFRVFCDNFIRSYISQQNRAEICFYTRVKQCCCILAIRRSFPGGHLVPKMTSYRHRCDVLTSHWCYYDVILRHVPAGSFFNFRYIGPGVEVTSQASVLWYCTIYADSYSAIRRGFPSPEWQQRGKSVLRNFAIIRV